MVAGLGGIALRLALAPAVDMASVEALSAVASASNIGIVGGAGAGGLFSVFSRSGTGSSAELMLGAESVAILPEKTVRFTELAFSASKADVRSLLRSGDLDLTDMQRNKLLKTLTRGQMDSITIKAMNNGNVRLIAERAGHTSGYQRLSYEVDRVGRTSKMMQTAYDDAFNLVPQRAGESKNNLYDVKQWKK